MMKKKLMALILCVLALCLCLSACGDKDADIKKALTASKWETVEIIDDDELSAVLEEYYFEPEEIAYADSSDFSFSRVYTFKDDGTVVLAYDTDKVYNTFYDGMDHFLDTLYAHQEDLVDVYGDDPFEDEQEFKSFMAWYISDEEWDTAAELLDAFAEDVVTFYFSEEDYTSMQMTYKVEDGMVKVYNGEKQWDELTYDADKGQLVSTADGETFTKVR